MFFTVLGRCASHLEYVHEGQTLQGAAGGQVRAGGRGQRHQRAVHALLRDHLHDGVAAAGAGVCLLAQVGEGLAPAVHHVGQRALVVGEVRVGGDGGGVARPQQDVARGVAGPGDLVLVQHGHQHGAGPHGVPGHDPVVQVHHVDQGRVEDDGQSGLPGKIIYVVYCTSVLSSDVIRKKVNQSMNYELFCNSVFWDHVSVM